MNLQFHATVEDIYDFIIDMLDKSYYIKGVNLFPDFETYDVEKGINVDEIEYYDRFYISKNEVEDADDYREFSSKRINTIGIDLGTRKPTESSMTEMIMWISAKDEIDPDFKRIINKFKRSMNRGAWGVAPGPMGGRFFYKNHMYTDRAKRAYEQGTKLCAYGGSVYFELPGKELHEDS